MVQRFLGNGLRVVFIALTTTYGKLLGCASNGSAFAATLRGCSGAAWLLCCAGIIVVGPEQFMILVSLAHMFLVVTGVFDLSLFRFAARTQNARAEGHRDSHRAGKGGIGRVGWKRLLK